MSTHEAQHPSADIRPRLAAGPGGATERRPVDRPHAAPSGPWRALLCGMLVVHAPGLPSGSAAAQAAEQGALAAIDEMFRWATPATPGCVVAVSLDGERVVQRAYGMADLEREIPMTQETVFDVGSLQKQFVAAAVLLLAQEERLFLTDDIREHLPELPDPGHVITVDHLLTHTSGIRDWTALHKMSSEDADALTLILRQRGLNFAPGEEWSYSNSGYVLLKELVARVSGTSFSRFAGQRLFEPLGMEATLYADDLGQEREGLALAYEKRGESWEPAILVGNERGGGALLSTAGDLLVWNDALTSGRLGELVTRKLQEPARLNNGRELGYARGLFLDVADGERVIWHGGSAGGYKALLGRFPELGFSIAFLSNAGDSAEGGALASRIRRLLVPPRERSETSEAEAPLSDESAQSAGAQAIDLDGKAGLFLREDTNEPLRLVVEGGSLRIEGGPALVPVAADRFRNPEGRLDFRSEDRFELRFASPDALETRSMEGLVTRYRRAQPYAPSAAELQDLAGSYGSDELSALVEAAPGAASLAFRLNGSQAFDSTPLARDTYQLGRMLVRFLRDEEGKVVGLDYSNPVLRHVRFTRLD